MIYPNYVKQSPVLGLTSGAAGGAGLSYFTHTVDAAPPAAEDSGSVSFDGNNDYLSIADSNDFNLGSGDFTIEAYVYANSFGSWDGIIGQWPQNGGNTANSFVFELVGGSVQFYYCVGSTIYGPINGGSLSTDTWHHVAAVRSGNTMYMFKDGMLYGNSGQSVTHTFNNPTSDVTIGGYIASAGYLNGKISNLRLVKGTALYTSNFTPPSSSLTAVTNTKLLCCQSTTSVTAAAVTPGTITNNGSSPSTSTPFTGGSVLFDGSGDCLTVADNADFEFGSGNFTIEAFINYTGNPGSGNSTYAIFSKWDNQNSNKGFILRLQNLGNGEKLQFFYTSDGNSNNISTGQTTLSPGTWYHIAFVRNGSTGTFYINGVADSTTFGMGSNSIRNTTVPFRIGANLDMSAISQEFNGLISNVRVIKGTALYTSNFTAPTSPLTNVTNTKLLCCQSDTSPTAAAVTPGTITNNGSIVSSFSPFDTGGDSGSVQFDGSDDHLNITGSDLAFGTGNFTLEFWVYFSSSDPTLDTIMETRSTTSASNGFLIGRFHTSGYENKIALYTAGGYQIASNSGVSNSTWTHVAVVRTGSTTKMYIDGVAQSTTYSDSNNYSNDDLIIGENANNTYQLHGLISNFRMVKGTAVYTSNFAVPTAPLINITNTKLLCCNSKTSATSSTITPGTIVNNGGATVSTSSPFVTLPSSAVFYASGQDFTDRGPNAYTITKVGGNLTVSNSVSKSGGGSFDFDGVDSEQYFYAGNNTFLNDSLSSWQFQCWARYTNSSGQAGNSSGDMGILIDQYPGSSYQGRLLFGFQSDALVMRVNGGTVELTSGAILSNNTWYHVLLNWDGTTHRLFIDGIMKDSSTTVPAVYTGKRTEFGGGGDLGGYNLHGYMEHILVENGGTVKTSNFTPNSSGFVT